ncbi:MAG: hypothetical protein QNI89_11030 [Desulfobacterales bacterium]|nr:hypothetical protein [Desulfobacterales bacterium]
MILFFVRAFNDIDHMTPVVWQMHRNRHQTTVLCLNPEYDIDHDYRLLFLRSLGVKVAHLYDCRDARTGGAQRVLCRLMFACFRLHQHLNRPGSGIVSSLIVKMAKTAREAGKLIYTFLKSRYYNHSWAKATLTDFSTRIICFDHVNPRQYVVNPLLDAAQEMGIPTLALPHGVFIYTNEVVKQGSTQIQRFEKFNRFDHVITQNELRKAALVRAGVQEEKIRVMGSARYCRQWITQNKQILPRTMSPENDSDSPSRLKAVFMTTRFAYRVDTDRMVKTFAMLSRIPGLDIVVKPHTRTGKERRFYADLPLPTVPDISSVELCEWADAVLVIASSIIVESMLLSKPALYLKYLHGNTTQYEEMGACWTIHSEQELEDAMLKLIHAPDQIPDTDRQTQAFLSEIIYGGRSERNVLENYSDFICDSA